MKYNRKIKSLLKEIGDKDKEKKKAARIGKWVKLIPFAWTTLFVVHVILLLLGYYEPITISIAMVLMAILLLLLSSTFDKCLLHKCMILYMIAGMVCICLVKLDVMEGESETVRILRIIMLVIGLILITLGGIKTFKNRKICKR